MERVRAAVAARDPAKDKLAADYAAAIADLIAEMKGEKKPAQEKMAGEEEKTDDER
jgi:hypothetical protein